MRDRRSQEDRSDASHQVVSRIGPGESRSPPEANSYEGHLRYREDRRVDYNAQSCDSKNRPHPLSVVTFDVPVCS